MSDLHVQPADNSGAFFTDEHGVLRPRNFSTPPYPAHTPPAPPEGMKWEYRGMGWVKLSESAFVYYTVWPNCRVSEVFTHHGVSGDAGTHIFEAVPILDAESGFTSTLDAAAHFFPKPTENPKEAAGREKCPMQLLPPEFLIQTANVMGAGASKYGAWNFRDTPIKLSTYLGAMMRHLTAIADGEDIDESGFPHIAHIGASCAILLDAAKHGKLIDDRPSKS
jgi:hypothetical protein